MIPVAGRPLLDNLLDGLADAGIIDTCLVVGPEHGRMRDHYARRPPERVRVHFAVQAEPRGTADAVLAAEAFAAGEPFLVLNSDNHYPTATLRALREAPAPALAGFDRERLAATGNIDRERIRAFALLDVGDDSTLRRIVEKPSAGEMDGSRLVSMNCWLLDGRIFEACRRIAPSARGELELPHAAQWLIDERAARFTVVPGHYPVLDLSSRADVAAVQAHLAALRPAP